MYVIVSAPESFLLKRRRDIIAKRVQHPGIYELTGVLKFADGSIYEHEGVLDFADVGLKTETGSRQARVVFPNPDRVLMPGQFVTVRFKGTVKTDVILVPQRAVQQGPKGPIVFVVAEGEKAEMRSVKAASWEGNQWIIEEGLKPGEQIIVDGFHKVTPGGPVKAVPVSANGATPEAASPAKPTQPSGEAPK